MDRSKILFRALKCFYIFKFPIDDIINIQKSIENSEELTFQTNKHDKCGVCKAKSKYSFIGYDLCEICQTHIESCFLLFHNGSVDISIHE